MFSTLRALAKVFLGTLYSGTDTTQTFDSQVEANQQIQAELAHAIEDGMVTTRQQEHASADTSLVEGLEGDKPKYLRKRKGDNEVEEILGKSGLKKKRVNGGPDHSAVDATKSNSPKVRISSLNDGAIVDGPLPQEPEAITHPNSPTLETPGFEMSPNSMGLTNGKRNEIPAKPLGSMSEETIEAGVSEELGDDIPTKSNSGKKRKRQDQANHATNGGVNATSPKKLASVKDNALEIKKPTHKRFPSEEPETFLHLSSHNDAQDHDTSGDLKKPSAPHVEDDSDDDAPETVTASVGLAQAQSASAEASKAAERQALGVKEKRRKKDTHLKEQALAAKKQRQSHIDKDSAPRTPQSNSKKGLNFHGPLPDLLPDEILAIEPVIRPPTPPPIIATFKSTKRRFIDADPKPSKDIKRGSVKVRILEDNQSTLPPRSSKVSKLLKESWLAGRRGRNDVASRRRVIGGGFLRK